MKRAPLLLLAASAWSVGARAEWHKAETPHYVVYSDSDEASLRQVATRLEKLDMMQRVVTHTRSGMPTIKPTVYVLSDMAAVQDTLPYSADGIAGYYSASTRGPFMVTARSTGGNANFTADLVTFHELTHYFMYQNFPAAYPTWFSEGIADFIGTAKINDTNTVVVGDLSKSRYQTLTYFPWMPLSELVAARKYSDVDNIYMLYAEGWLLTHYLTLGGKREGQLAAYLTGINQGKSFADSAKAAFGNLNDLDVEVQAYARRRVLPTRILTFKDTLVPAVAISTVAPARAALMIYDLRLNSGVPATKAKDFAGEVRTIAARYPNDPFALRIRAEADRLAGDTADATSTTQHWLALAPNDPMAMLLASLAEMDALEPAKATNAAAWTAARRRIASAYQIAPNEPLILKAYYDSYKRQHVTPTESAQNALFKALDLIPQDEEARYELAADFEARGLTEDAIAIIRVAAYAARDDDPKNEKEKQKQDKMRAKYRLAGEIDHEQPREMLKRLEAKVASISGAGTAGTDRTAS